MKGTCQTLDCTVPEECAGQCAAACQPLPLAPAGCPSRPECDEWTDGACHAHCWDDGETVTRPDGDMCEVCTEDAAYAARAARERQIARGL